MNEITSSATITVADAAYAQFTRFFDSQDLKGYDRAESVFLNTRSDSADHIARKLQIAESYFDESGDYPKRDITRAVIDMVNLGHIDDAIHYAQAIVNNDTIDDYCANTIRSAIADLEAVWLRPLNEPPPVGNW